MSQIGSSSGVRVAAQPLSNVYTVLLLIGAVALVLTAVSLAIYMDKAYGTILGGEEALKAVDAAQRRQAGVARELDQADDALKKFPEGVATTPPAVTPPAPAPPAPTPPETETTPPEATPPATPPPAEPANE